ncbi:MAG TPA: glucosamine-6-phosphate deaminase [Abditibacteriaceae bacterium]|jgi:glucosamine-6-phosphate deaminase
MTLAPPFAIYPDYLALCREVAARIAEIVREKPNAVLGLATGSTPIGVYKELIRRHREEGLDFSGVTCFNLDEYVPLMPDAPQSYHRFMREQLFDAINCQNWHVPSGEARDISQIERDCADYEKAIADAGGLDFQLLGIGRSGHIGFNEPGSGVETRTRLVVLDSVTRSDAASTFFGLENTPARAITMGVGTILEAREIALLASGAQKAAIVKEALEGKITSKVPASLLRGHPNVTWHLDTEAASELTDFPHPWRLLDADWNDADLQRHALCAIALETGKALADLGAEDLAAAGAASVLDSQKLQSIKSSVRDGLTASLSDELLPSNQTVLCLSPHPDDDVICCGATLLKLAARGNRLFVAYGVNGANAVRDKDVLALLRAQHPRLISYLEEHLEPGKSLDDAVLDVRVSIFERESGAPDSPLLRELKRLVREGEASDACRKMGAKPLFLDLPFYGDGAQRLPLGEGDITRTLQMLETVKPDLVLLTGEKNDPHGTHVMCETAFNEASARYEQKYQQSFVRWNYRGAWDDYQLHEGDYFSIFDKATMERKIDLILDHISQLDPLFPGEQTKEFWERARDRNRENARQLQRVGILPPSRSFDPIYAEVFRFSDDIR